MGFNVSNVKIGSDGAIELTDAELIELEQSFDERTVIAGGFDESCGNGSCLQDFCSVSNAYTCENGIQCTNTNDTCTNDANCSRTQNGPCTNEYASGCGGAQNGNCRIGHLIP